MNLLTKDQQNNPNATETHFCIPLSKFVPIPLTEDQTKFMLIVGMAKEDKLPQMEKDFREMCWFYEAIDKRLKAMFSYKMDVKSKLVLCSWCETIGDLAIYLTYIQYKCKERNIKDLDLDALAHIFPMGIFDRKFVKTVWDGQKVERGEGYSDNIIDYPNALKSILF
jgi:hypothetical protein